MLSIHRQKTRDRVDLVSDTMMASQAQPKDIKAYVAELAKEVGDAPVTLKSDASAFLNKNPKMKRPSPKRPPTKKKT